MTELKAPPNPPANVWEQAMALLVSIGGPKERSAFLEEGHALTKHNEKVYKEAQTAIETLRSERDSFEIAKARAGQELEDQRKKLAKESLDLLERKQAFATEREQAQNQINNERNTLNAKSGDLERLRVELSMREAKLQGEINQFNNERDKFSQRVSEIQERESRLSQREEQLRKILSG